MIFRPKTLRRVGVLLIVLMALASLTGWLIHRQGNRSEESLHHDRQSGMTAYNRGDYTTAVALLENYVGARPDDDQAVLAFAVARSRVETNNSQHLKQALTRLDELLKRHPDNLAAKHALIEIYPRTGNTEALARLSNELLANNPDDGVALRGRIAVLIWQNKLDEALTDARHFADLAPNDFERNIRVLHLMSRLNRPAAEVIAYAREKLDQQPDNPRFIMLMAFAHNYAGESGQASDLLEKAAAMPIDDPSFVRQLSSLLDLLKRFDESQRLLERTAKRTHDVEVTRILITRLWQSGKNDEILARLADLDPASARSDSQLLALRAMAYYQTQRLREARAIVDQLRKRETDAKAVAWVLALEARFEDYKELPAAINDKLSRALQRDPENGIIRSWIADSYWAINESSLALRHWSMAAMAMPSWSRPYVGMSQAMLQVGRTSDALLAAQGAFERMPNTSAAINLAIIRNKLIEESGDIEGAKNLLSLVEQVQQTRPGEPLTLPINISLLSRTGRREEAVAALQKVCDDLSRYDPDTLLRLASVSRSEGLDRESELLRPVEGQKSNPRLSLARASLLADAGHVNDGLNLLDSAAAKGADGSAVEYAVARCQYLEMVNAATAEHAWKTLGEQYPTTLEVQKSILAAGRSTRSDRPFIGTTIDRLRLITGQDSQLWKLERARYLIESTEVMRDGVEAAKILTSIVAESPRQIEPRLQLARALEKTGNTSSAIEHLRAAQALDARSANVTLELVRLLQEQGQTDEVKKVLKNLSANVMMTARQRVMLASLFADTGDSRRAIDLLAPDEAAGTLLPPGRLLLAELYRRVGENNLAAEIYRSALTANEVSPGLLASAAEFHASAGEVDRARELLNRLSSTGASSDEVAITRGRFEERFGRPDATLAQYRDAYANGGERGVLALVDYLLRTQDYAQAETVARQSQIRFPNSSSIANKILEAQGLAAEKSNPRNLQTLIDALARDPTRIGEVEALQALYEYRNGRMSAAELLPKLRTISERYTRYLPLQQHLADAYLNLGQADEAVQIVRRTMEAMPTDPDAARLAVRVLRDARRWGEMRVAAEKWREQTNGGTMEADVAIAEALLELKNPTAAEKQLADLTAQITNNVRSLPHEAVILARIYVARQRSEAARDLLRPLLSESSGRRMWLAAALTLAPSLDDSVQWVESVVSTTPTENWEERLTIAQTWAGLARRYGHVPLLQNAKRQLEMFLNKRPQSVDALLLLAGIQIELTQPAEGEKSLRKLLALRADFPPACNDLAYLLMIDNRSLSEAEHLGRVAVEKEPRRAIYYDTLGRILLKQKRYAEAQTTFTAGLKIQPDLIEARIGLARSLAETGKKNEAIRELKLAETQALSVDRVAEPLKVEMASLKDDLQ